MKVSSKKKFAKKFFSAAMSMVLVTSSVLPALAEGSENETVNRAAVNLPDPIYFFDFENAVVGGSSENATIASTGGTHSGTATIKGSGEIEDVAGKGKVFHNAVGGQAVRTNYLVLPEDSFSYSAESKGVTIGFWVNVGTATDYWNSPIFSAYAQDTNGSDNGMPMLVLQSRLLAQMNCNGWSDFTTDEWVNGIESATKETTVWLDDKEWHYYTAVFDDEILTIYIDGIVQNQWDATKKDGCTLAGLYSNGNELKHIALGGNQAWNWADIDAAYMFDDVAIYNTALTEAQIYYLATGEIMNEADKTELNAAIIAADSIRPELYKEDTVNNFQEKLSAAKLVKIDGQAEQETVDSAKEALIAAQEALVKKPVDLNDGIVLNTDLTDTTSSIDSDNKTVTSGGYVLGTTGTSSLGTGYIQLSNDGTPQTSGAVLEGDVLHNLSVQDGFTISAKINFSESPSTDWIDLLYIVDTPDEEGNVTVISRSTYGFITFTGSTGLYPGTDCKNGFVFNSCTSYTTNTLKTFTITVDENSISYYVDGVLACKKTDISAMDFATVLKNANKIYIGRASGTGDKDTQGTLNGVTIYNRALNEAEVDELHTTTPSVYTVTTEIDVMEGSTVTVQDGDKTILTTEVDSTEKVLLKGLTVNKEYTYTVELPEGYAAEVTGENAGADTEGTFTALKDDSDNVIINAVKKTFVLSDTELELNTNETAELELSEAAPENTVIQSVKSSDESVVTAVLEDGKVSLTAVGAGDAIITVTASNGLEAECTVTVTDIEVTSIELSETSVTINKGETKAITAEAKPDNATTSKTIEWTSKNELIATVDSDGTITAKGAGTTIITASCGSITAECEVTVNVLLTGIVLNKSEMTLSIYMPDEGDAVIGSDTLLIEKTPEDATEEIEIEWSSSDNDVATVAEDGTVTAVAAGEAVITATASNGMTATCKVIVGETTEYIEVEGLELDKAAAEVELGKMVQITATITPDNATNKMITWTSSDENVATVTNGVVTAISKGTATITATTSNGKTAECEVTVKVEVSEVSLDKQTISLKEGETDTLTATVNPDDATNKTITWASSNTDVATIAEDGTITAVSTGEATITATASNGVKAECKVTVSPATVEVSEIVLNQETISLTTGETSELTVTINPENATDKTITWASGNENVATVVNGVVTAVSAGEATITATASNGVKAECKVTVSAATVEVSEVVLDKETISLTTGETSELTATINPEDATDKTITWTSSNENVAAVTNGVVTAVSAGEATITATASNGVKAECKVTVSAATVEVSEVVLDKAAVSLKTGETNTLTATINPENATDKTITWTSSNESVATVNNGVITAVSAGEATITATASNGVKAECKVTVETVIVKVEVEGIVLDRYTISLESGEKTVLTATVNPENASVKGVTWSSDNPSVATVDQSGNITAISAGTANIIVVSQDNENITVKCAVTVTQKQTDDNQPEEGKPFIKGEDGTEGWEAIKDQIDNTESGESIVVDMNGTTVVEGSVISEAKEKNIDITFEVESGIKWTIKASDITADIISDIDLRVEKDTGAIKEEKIAEVAKDKKTTQLSLADNENFGFTAILTINVGSENAGKFANLYYYNPQKDVLEFMGASPVYANGDTDLTFTHASDYVIVFDDKDYTSSNDNKTENDGKDNTSENDNKDKDSNTPPATGDSMITRIDNLYILMVCAIAAIFGVGIFNIRKKEK